MTPPSYNEADTRTKLIDPVLHARQWIELVKDEQRIGHGEIQRDQSAVRIDILSGKPKPSMAGRCFAERKRRAREEAAPDRRD